MRIPSSRRALLALVTAAIVPSAAGAQGFSLPLPIASPVDASRAPTAFDVDQDGDVDLVGSDSALRDLYVLENLGGGEFAIARRLQVNLAPLGEPLAIGSTDIDADGVVDLYLVVRPAAGQYRLVRLDASLPSVIFPVAEFDLPATTEPGRELRFRDLDDDGALDIEFVRPPRDAMGVAPSWIALQRGNGFDFVELTAGLPAGSAVCLVDADDDGRADLVARTGPSVVSVLLQTAPGVFGSVLPIDSQVSADPIDSALASDLDGDGIEELLLLFRGSLGLVAYQGLAGGQFGPRLPVAPGPPGAEALLADLDGDSDDDVALLPEAPAAPLRWIEGLPGLAFGPTRDVVSLPGDALPEAVGLFDLEDDGTPELVVQATPSLYLLDDAPASGTGGLPFAPLRGGLIDDTLGHELVRIADLDGDGDGDAVSTRPLAVSFNRGPGRFDRPAPRYDLDVDLIDVADLDEDGLDDVIAREGSQLVWLRSGGGGGFARTALAAMSTATTASPTALDIGADQDPDVIAVAGDGRSVFAVERDASGGFGAPRTLLTEALPIVDLETADLDGDGREDLIVASRSIGGGAASVRWFRQLPNGSFTPSVPLANDAVTAGERLIATDVNGSGAIDVGWISNDGASVVLAENLGSGTFAAAVVQISLPGAGLDLAALDRGAGAGVDLAVTIERSTPLESEQLVRLSRTSGLNFAPPVSVAIGLEAPASLASADLDSDGDTDLVVGGRLSWLRSNANAPLGDLICGGATPNSTGRKGELSAFGTRVVASNDVTLIATELPPRSVTLFLASQTFQFTPNFGGGVGLLCIGGEVGRFDAPGQVGLSSLEGRSELAIDLTMIPQPTGAVSVLAGEQWAFQAWHRDVASGSVTSNLTQGVALPFL
ncbi:MAG: VCBS repeat-containing protein [Planctomycetota bacterium]